MVRGLKIHWAIWAILVSFVTLGVLAYTMSAPKSVTVKLRPNELVEMSTFRPHSHSLELFLEFVRTKGDERTELGDYRTSGLDWKKAGFLEFPNPGTPIKLLVRIKGKDVVYEALPRGGHNARMMSRDLIPFVDDGNPNRFQWPPDHTLRLNLPSGYSKIHISVLEIGAPLLDEQVTLFIKSPISLKFMPPSGYGIIWWFMFWPLYVFSLVVYGAILLRMSMG